MVDRIAHGQRVDTPWRAKGIVLRE